jgi:hypothetical protein
MKSFRSVWKRLNALSLIKKISKQLIEITCVLSTFLEILSENYVACSILSSETASTKESNEVKP